MLKMVKHVVFVLMITIAGQAQANQCDVELYGKLEALLLDMVSYSNLDISGRATEQNRLNYMMGETTRVLNELDDQKLIVGNQIFEAITFKRMVTSEVSHIYLTGLSGRSAVIDGPNLKKLVAMFYNPKC